METFAEYRDAPTRSGCLHLGSKLVTSYRGPIVDGRNVIKA